MMSFRLVTSLGMSARVKVIAELDSAMVAAAGASTPERVGGVSMIWPPQ